MPVGQPARAQFFADCVTAAAHDVERRCPAALVGVRIAVDDVPRVGKNTVGIPLAAAVESRAGQPAHIVLYRRPLEHRATSRAALRAIVHRMLVEQLVVLTGHSISELAGDDFDPDW